MAKAKIVPLKETRCPVCGRPTVPAFKPFCSARCADVDLGRWLKGDYRIPTQEAPEEAPPEADETPEDR
jgi:endogenous inhibitor of DNA gyrase (YacG/DUF329 family)